MLIPRTSRLARSLAVLVAMLAAAGALAAMPAAHAAADFPLNLPVPVGATIRAGGPHVDSGSVRNSVDFGAEAVGGSLAVYAAAAGTVERIVSEDGFSRCRVRIDHADGWATQYQHLINVPASLAEGHAVAAGQLLGYAGIPQGDTCGSGSGRHVHFALYRNNAPASIDGTSIGGYTVHNGGSNYAGTWTDDDTGATVVNSSGYMACCLINDKQHVTAEDRESGHSVVSDNSGRMWSFAVTQSGTLKYRFTGSSGWQGWLTVGSGYKSVAAAVDGSGRVAFAYVTDDGVMKVRRTNSVPTATNDGGGFGSSSAAFGAGDWANVSMATDRLGRIWLAATKTYGRAYYMNETSTGTWPATFHEFGNDDWQSVSIAAESGADGRVFIFGTKSTAGHELWYKRTQANLVDWDAMNSVGTGWSGDVSATGDNVGRMWMFAVTAGGDLKYRHTDASGWDSYVTIPQSDWASVSSGVKSTTGVMWMFGTTTNGDLSYRYTDTSSDNWTSFAAVTGGPWK